MDADGRTGDNIGSPYIAERGLGPTSKPRAPLTRPSVPNPAKPLGISRTHQATLVPHALSCRLSRNDRQLHVDHSSIQFTQGHSADHLQSRAATECNRVQGHSSDLKDFKEASSPSPAPLIDVNLNKAKKIYGRPDITSKLLPVSTPEHLLSSFIVAVDISSASPTSILSSLRQDAARTSSTRPASFGSEHHRGSHVRPCGCEGQNAASREAAFLLATAREIQPSRRHQFHPASQLAEKRCPGTADAADLHGSLV